MKGDKGRYRQLSKFDTGHDGVKFKGTCNKCRFKNYAGHREWCQQSKKIIINCEIGEE